MSNRKNTDIETGNRKSRRKALLKKFQKQHPEQLIVWKNGQLIFAKNNQPVPEVPHLSKPTKLTQSPTETWHWRQRGSGSIW